MIAEKTTLLIAISVNFSKATQVAEKPRSQQGPLGSDIWQTNGNKIGGRAATRVGGFLVGPGAGREEHLGEAAETRRAGNEMANGLVRHSWIPSIHSPPLETPPPPC